MAAGQAPTARGSAHGTHPPWHRVPTLVVDAIFDALADTELFDCFVLESIENSLVVQYEQLGREGDAVSVVNAQISQILCQAGSEKLVWLERELRSD
jgi:hypothetical protein